MGLSKEQKIEIISQHGASTNDTGSSTVQIAMLTASINALSSHLQSHKQDFHGQRSLLKMVGRRKRLLSHMEKTDYDGYKALIQKLGLRR
jgi:small subunit ribosomal protein S15